MNAYNQIAKSRFRIACAVLLAASFLVFSCRKDPVIVNPATNDNVVSYIDKNPQFSQFRKILELSGTDGFLGAYGSYTVFAPNNDAIAKYLTARGKSSVQDIDTAELKNIVRFHVLQDTISSQSFTDGKLPVLTMLGQYLVTGASNIGGVSHVTINRQANVLLADKRLTNAVFYEIDNVLTPPEKTLAQLIESNPKYSIFTKALKVTGWYDKLNILPKDNPDKSKAFLTVFAQTDSSFAADSIDTFEGTGNRSLMGRFSNTSNPANADNKLNQFVSYHVSAEAKYLADLIVSPQHTTFATGEILSTKLVGQTLVINDMDFNDKHETGISINKSNSDISAKNGVLHEVSPYTYVSNGVRSTSTGLLAIAVRVPQRIDWDVAQGIPELIKRPEYLKGNYTIDYTITTGGLYSTLWGSGTTTAANIVYTYSAAENAFRRDYLNVPLAGPNRNPWVEFKTPFVVKGKYYFWINFKYFRSSTNNTRVISQVTITDQVTDKDGNTKDTLLIMPRTWDALVVPSSTITPADALQAGFKKYLTNGAINTYTGRSLGLIELKSTGFHRVRITHIAGSSQSVYIDMMQFIPEKEDQLYPQFAPDGTKVDKNGKIVQ